MFEVKQGSIYFDQVDSLFQKSFDYKERAKDLKEAHEEGTLTLALVQDDVVVCFANYRDYGDFVYMEHIATLEKARGQNIASIFFKYFMDNWKLFVIEVNMTSSIVDKYVKMGFVVNPYDYRVPAYGGNPCSERYLFLSYPKVLDIETYERIKTKIFEDAYSNNFN